MRLAIFLIVLPVVTATAAAAEAQRRPLGIFFKWGAFEDQKPRKCFAITEPAGHEGAKSAPAFASVTSWPGRGAVPQLHFRLARKKRPGSAVILKIDGRSFQLLAGGANAWARNEGADAQIIAAMRTGVRMSLNTRAEQGGLIRDIYPLRGAATAIDAAIIACARPDR
ncbi:MAG: hypothetical protein H0W74_01095 [Sphingosinicella sp.]|nr:hypothetical protein [Sphingosinicella sp.]